MVEELLHDGARITLAVGALLVLTVGIAWVSRRLRVPAPLAFLAIGVAVSSATGYRLDAAHGDILITAGSLALSVILFEGGFNGGWSRTRGALGPILSIGLVGTFLTAAAMAALGHWLLGLSWGTAALIGVALSPTDPATVFSVLGSCTLQGRTGEVLEGESGVNDPVGIALMLGTLDIVLHGAGGGAVLDVARTFAMELGIGVLGGLVVGLAGNWLLTHVPLPSYAVHATAAIAVAMLAFGLTAAVHGSGFLAAFVAGMAVGEEDIRLHSETEDTLSVVANLGETTMFLLLGLTITFEAFDDSIVIELATFALLTFLVRPVLTHLLLAPTSLPRKHRSFIAWGGLRGAVPILLGFFVLVDDVPDDQLIYTVVFVAVTLSMLVQGTTLPAVGRRLGVIKA